MRIVEAKFCLDCDEIVHIDITTCPKCGNREFTALKNYIKPMESILEMAKNKKRDTNAEDRG